MYVISVITVISISFFLLKIPPVTKLLMAHQQSWCRDKL